jgi:hypothetical protein
MDFVLPSNIKFGFDFCFLLTVAFDEEEESNGGPRAFVDWDFDGPPTGFLVVDLSTSASAPTVGI